MSRRRRHANAPADETPSNGSKTRKRGRPAAPTIARQQPPAGPPQAAAVRAAKRLLRFAPVRDIPITDIHPDPSNPRSISKEALDGLRASIEEFGVVEQLVWNEQTGQIVGGHQRWVIIELLREKGVTAVPCSVVNLSPEGQMLLNLALNNLAIQGKFTDDVSDLVKQIEEQNAALVQQLRLDTLKLTRETRGSTTSQMGALEYRVIVDCTGEQHQVELLERFEKEGLPCRALIS